MSHFAGSSVKLGDFVLWFFYSISHVILHFEEISHKNLIVEAMQLQLKNACSVRMSVTFTFLARMYYAAVLNHGTTYTWFFPPKYNVRPASWLECNCDAVDLILPCPKSCTFAFSYASCLYSPAQREFFTCWWCCSSWAFPSSSRRNYTPKSQVQVVIQTIKSETGLLICYMQICKSASSSEEEFVIGWRHLEDQRKIVIGLFHWKHFLKEIKKPFQTGTV